MSGQKIEPSLRRRKRVEAMMKSLDKMTTINTPAELLALAKNGCIEIEGDCTIKCDVTLLGCGEHIDSLRVTGNLSCDGHLRFDGNLDCGGNLNCDCDLSCTANLRCGRDLDCGGYLHCGGNLSCGGNLRCGDNLLCGRDLDCGKNLRCGGNLDCTANLHCGDNLRCCGNLRCGDNLHCGRDLNCDGEASSVSPRLGLTKYSLIFFLRGGEDAMAYGCESQTISWWKDNMTDLCKENEPAHADEYATFLLGKIRDWESCCKNRRLL